jgi:hypothetical protein
MLIRRLIYIPFSDRVIPFESWWAIAGAILLEAHSYWRTKGVGVNYLSHMVGLFSGIAVGWCLRWVGAVPEQKTSEMRDEKS